RRRWEWYHLNHLRHSELHAFRFRTDGFAMTALSGDGGRLAASGPDGVVRLWDVASGQEVLALSGRPDLQRCFCFSPDATRLRATDPGAGVLKRGAARAGGLLGPLPHEPPVETGCFSPDGHTLATCGTDLAVRFWDLRTGKQTRVVPNLMVWAGIKRLSFSP